MNASSSLSPIASLRNVSLSLPSTNGKVEILRDVSLELPRGKIVSIMGPSGSGKTTLLMILSGLEKPSAGTVTVATRDLSDMDEDALARFRRDNIGIVFQNFHLIPTMTALENVAMPMELAGDAQAFEKARQNLADVGLSHRETHYPGQLSGGEQQRVAIARAFAGTPALILADEPTGNLDAETGEKIIELMFRLARSGGSTLALVTHDPALSERCDTTLHIRDGRITA